MLAPALVASLVLVQPTSSLPYVFKSGLNIGTPGNPRTILRRDPVEAALVTNALSPKAGDKLGNGTWTQVTAQNDQFPNLRGYLYVSVDWPATELLLLESTGASVAYVNGEPRTGDPYGYGYASLPILMNRGVNTFLFASAGRGGFAAKLVRPPAPFSLDLRDPTFPDLIEGEKGRLWGSVIVRNASLSRHSDLTLEVKPAVGKSVLNKLPIVMPQTIRKMPFQLDASSSADCTLILRQGSKVFDQQKITLRRLKPGQVHKRTFVSSIDGSVQYYAVNPSSTSGPNQALFLSLHGASVEGLGQAEAYSRKSWGDLVAATNRRPYGFDWEEVGRLDALEVLGLAQKALKSDPNRTYLQGHSMGGHGTWQIGAHFPDRFAAIAPAAGWISFATYGNGGTYGDATPLQRVMNRANNPSNTLALANNYKQQAIFILHGDADDNVPLSEARTMRENLSKFHQDLHWHEEPGQGHWYDTDPGPGANCVDYAPIYDLFARRRIPASREVRELDFTTASPGINSKCHWLEVLQQEKPFAFSRAQLKATVGVGFAGTTENIKAMTLDASLIERAGEVPINIDGTKINVAPDQKGVIHLVKRASGWMSGAPGPQEKSPARSGGWKDVLKNNVLFVVGTAVKANTRANGAKARFDAEQFWYRGNSSVEVILDMDFKPALYKDRNIVLYGNRAENSAWDLVLDAKAPLVEPGRIRIGTHTYEGADLAAYFIYPRKDSASASVGVVAGTGIAGQKLTERVPVFTAGAAMPDFFVFRPAMLTEGESGVAAAGFFDNQWNPEADSHFAN